MIPVIITLATGLWLYGVYILMRGAEIQSVDVDEEELQRVEAMFRENPYQDIDLSPEAYEKDREALRKALQ